MLQKCDGEVSVCVAESMLEVLEQGYMSEADATVGLYGC